MVAPTTGCGDGCPSPPWEIGIMGCTMARPRSGKLPPAIRLVLSDVDGTLVTQAKELTPRAIEAVRRLGEAGIMFALTSGRPPRGMADVRGAACA